MYTDLFKLRELPFRLSPDPQFLYLSKQHARAKAYMESTIWFTDGFVVITGEIGSGKTTLIESFLKELPRDVVIAQINQTQVSAVDFLQSVLVQFGFQPFKMKKGELIATLNNFLIEQYAADRKVLLIVDEAQNLSLRVLEEIRLLSGVETTKEKVLRIILAGQPELNDKLDAPELVQLAQRVRLRFHLTTLSPEEMQAYIKHRLEVAGAGDREIFAPETFPEIFRYTGGVPRLVNTLCDTAMMSAFTSDRDHVLVSDIAGAVEELRWLEFSQRNLQQQIIRTGPGYAGGPARVSTSHFGGAAPPSGAPHSDTSHSAASLTGPAHAGSPHAADLPQAGSPHAAAPHAGQQIAPGSTLSSHTGVSSGSARYADRSDGFALPPVREQEHEHEHEHEQIVGRIIVATEGRTTQEVPLKIGRIIIGRTPDNDVQVESRFVSRHHCQIITTAHGSVVEDLNSTNGIYVQAKRVRRHNLNDGDVIMLGKHELLYLDERAPRSRPSGFAETVPGSRPGADPDSLE